MDDRTQRKWDHASRSFDVFSFADDRRLGPAKRKLFEKIRGRTLLVAAGTGNDFKFLPPRLKVTAIDISPKMLAQAAKKTAGNVQKAGFRLRRVENVYLDVVKAIEAVKDGSA